MNRLFFDLIQVSLGKIKSLDRIPSEKEWKSLFNMSIKQSVSGICFYGIQVLSGDADKGYLQTGMSESQYYDWMAMALQIQQNNEIINKQCVELQSILHSDGFKNSLLKGQGIGQMYGALSSFRQNGDIDMIVDSPMWDVIRYTKAKCPEVRSIMSHHIDFPVFSDTAVELHFRPAQLCNPFTNRTLLKWYDKHKTDVFENEVTLENGAVLTAPDSDFNAVYILLHIYKHLFAEGISLKQILDLYYVLKSSFNKEECRENIHELKMDRFAAAMMWIMKECLCLDDDYLICKPNEKEGRWLLDDIMKYGNLGGRRKNWIKSSTNPFIRFRKMFVANLRLLIHYPSEAIWFPLFKLWHYPWRRYMENRMKYL